MRTGLVPGADVIDQIPSRGRVLVVMHHWFHAAMDHVTAFHGLVKVGVCVCLPLFL